MFLIFITLVFLLNTFTTAKPSDIFDNADEEEIDDYEDRVIIDDSWRVLEKGDHFKFERGPYCSLVNYSSKISRNPIVPRLAITQQPIDRCSADGDCWKKGWGPHSRCNHRIRKCECYDQRDGGKSDTILVGGICYIKRLVGDQCRHNDQCSKTIKGRAYCTVKKIKQRIKPGVCVCESGFYSRTSLEECLPIRNKIGDDCVEHEQCTRGALGELSVCFGNSKDAYHCSCDSNTIYYEKDGGCITKKKYGDICKSGEECRLTLGKNAVCLHLMCLPLAMKMGDECMLTEQCRNGSLGDLSRCIGGKCVCDSSDGMQQTAYHDGINKCFHRKGYNDSCSKHAECEASLGHSVRCGRVRNTMQESSTKICYCPTGKICGSPKDYTVSAGYVLLPIISSLALSIISGSVVFSVHRYMQSG